MTEAKRVYANFLAEKIESLKKEGRRVAERSGEGCSVVIGIMRTITKLEKEFEEL